jgi:RNA polymerase-binding transcription factor DksA
MKISFPQRILSPIGKFLRREEKKLKERKKALSTEDPFTDTDRVNDNAASDTDAREQFGHARILAMREEIDRKLVQIRKALTRIKIGKYGICEQCGKMIDTDRLVIYPEATVCVDCERKRERKE